MGLMLSVVISYAGALEAIELIRHLFNGIIPNADPDFEDLIQYYNKLLQNSANPSHNDWISACGQGYLCLKENQEGNLESAAVKFYDGQPSSTALLFSTKISSFGQDSLEDNSLANGGYNSERYTLTKTKTIISNTSESFSVGNRRRSPTYNENVSDSVPYSSDSSERRERNATEANDEKVSWEYSPLTPTSPLPEIHFQSYDEDKPGNVGFSEEYLRSLDGIKFRPLQRRDPSGRRRSFRKRHSSSSNSSRDSRASREEEVKMFTSLEEAEFKNMNKEVFTGFGSSPNLAARSYSRSRSRESSRERKHESWSVEAAGGGSVDDDKTADIKPQNKPSLDSFEEKDEPKETNEVKEDAEDDFDFWGNVED